MTTIIDPQVRTLLEQFRAQAAAQPVSEVCPTQQERIAETRQFIAAANTLSIASEPIARVEDLRIPGPGGELRIRVYTPRLETLLPVLVYYHAGAFVAGDLDGCDSTMRALANRAQCIIVSVEYRLAPEHPYPAANEDCWTALQWVSKHAEEIGVDASRLAVGGESAGGLLAAWVAQRAANDGPPLRVQMLLCPNLDATISMHSWTDLGTGEYVIASQWMKDNFDAYLPKDVDRHSSEVSPLFASDLSGIAPAIIVTADHDPLRDEGEAYARKLKEAGVYVEYTCVTGMIHAPLSLAGVLDAGKALADQLGKELQKAFS